jgi:hypothetical protein
MRCGRERTGLGQHVAVLIHKVGRRDAPLCGQFYGLLRSAHTMPADMWAGQ